MMQMCVQRYLSPVFAGSFGALVYLCVTAWLHYQALEAEFHYRSADKTLRALEYALNRSAVAALVLFAVVVLYLLLSERRAAWLLSNSDVSQKELIAQAEKLDVLAKQARKASDAKSEFLAMMSHDIRTPMNAIIGYSDILAETKLDDEQASYVSAMMLAGENMLGLINDILDLTRLESGKMDLRETDFAPAQLLQSLENVIRVIAAKNGNEVIINVDPHLKAGMRADMNRLNQVLLNLAGNAAKFTHNGTIALHASLTHGGERIGFIVSDTGEGIPEELQSRLFQPFEQGENGRAAGKNSNGLGLAISDRIVRLMGGKIGFCSDARCGTSFFFDLPYVNGACGLAEFEVRTAVRPDFQLGGLRVLLADDTPANLMVATAMLEKSGMVVVAVNDGESAILAAQSGMFDLMIIDIQMPDISGIKVAQAVRAMAHDISVTPMIALTAQSFPREREKALAGGFDAFLSKPIRASDLIACVCAVAGQTNKEPSRADMQGGDVHLDDSVFAELLEAVGAQEMPGLIGRFERDVFESLEQLMLHHPDASSERVTHLAHKLSGLLSQIGIVRAAEFARSLEVCAPDQRRSDDLERLADSARTGLQLLRQLLRKNIYQHEDKAA